MNHPFEILGTRGNNPRAQRITGGDTVIIKNGSYRMGYTPGAYDTGACGISWTGDCYMNPVPSGPAADAKTKIYGEEYASGCAAMPELWATHGAYMLLNLEGSSNVDLQCLDVTDHEDCGGLWSAGNKCDLATTPAYGAAGVRGWNGANNSFTNVKLHGFAGAGAVLGKQASLTMTDVDVVGNGLVGIDQDNSSHPGDNSWTGNNRFTRLRVNWNGCAENFPVNGGYNNCTDQNDTGYGDGWGSPGGGTGGSFAFADSQFMYNTSDGLDLLYLAGSSSSITIERSRFEGNVGNAVKVGGGDNTLRNNIIIANCNYWAGKPFVGPHFSTCRAGGNPVVVNMAPGTAFDAVNNTVSGESDILFELFGCNGDESINIRNNIVFGQQQWNTPAEKASWYYGYGGCGSPTSADTNIIYNVKESSPCTGRSACIQADPQFVALDYRTAVFDVRLRATSPGLGAGLATGVPVGSTRTPADDFNSMPRGDGRVLGAIATR